MPEDIVICTFEALRHMRYGCFRQDTLILLLNMPLATRQPQYRKKANQLSVLSLIQRKSWCLTVCWVSSAYAKIEQASNTRNTVPYKAPCKIRV